MENNKNKELEENRRARRSRHSRREEQENKTINDNQEVVEKDLEKKSEAGYAVLLQNLAIYSVFRKLILVSLFCLVALIVCFSGLFFYTTESIEPRYIPVSENGSFIKEVPITERGSIDDGEVSSNALKVLKILNTYDFKNYKNQIIEAEPYFTMEGWENYQKSLTEAGNLKYVESTKAIVSVKVDGIPEIKSDLKNGIFLWRIVIPSTITYTSFSQDSFYNKENIQRVNAYFYYKRVPLSENPRQYAIFQMRLEPLDRYGKPIKK